MDNKDPKSHFVKIIVPLALAAVLVAGGVIYATRNVSHPRACTEEAKQCPDGSYVGRTGPDCEFAACPSVVPSPAPVPTPSPADCSGPGGSCPDGYACIQKCGPPVVRVNEPAPGYYCELKSIASKPRMCPVCLASNTLISTPAGDINVKDLKVGMVVWSLDAHGEKTASRVISVSHADAPPTHKVVDLVLSDGREVWVSPNHPAVNGRPVGSFVAGDAFDGAFVRSADLVPYWDKATYDLLPASATGAYWANGILLQSTLFPPR
jgi:hypothetical protein